MKEWIKRILRKLRWWLPPDTTPICSYQRANLEFLANLQAFSSTQGQKFKKDES